MASPSNTQNSKKDETVAGDMANHNDEKTAHENDEYDAYQDLSPEYVRARDIVDASMQQKLHVLTKPIQPRSGRDMAETIVENQRKIDETKREDQVDQTGKRLRSVLEFMRIVRRKKA